MKTSLSIITVITVCVLLLSCEKDETTKTNTIIEISNDGNNTYNEPDYQFTSLELTPTDNSSSTKSYSFVSTIHSKITISVKLPKNGSYKIKINANDNVGYLQWNSIAMEIGGKTNIYLYCPGNLSYKDGSTAAGIAPDTSSGL